MDLGGWSSAGVRPLDEDAYALLDLSAHSDALGGLRAFLAVSDGRGWTSSGELAAKTAIETARAYVVERLAVAGDTSVGMDPRAALADIFDLVDRTLAASPDGDGLGATLTAAFVGVDHVWIGHIGDSRAYVLRGDWAHQITSDYSRVEPVVAKGGLVWVEDVWERHKSRPEKVLGLGAKETEFQDATLQEKDAVVLCTDGVCSALTATEILMQAARGKNAAHAARHLCDGALESFTKDNVTAVVWAEDWRAFRAGVAAAMRAAGQSGPLALLSAALEWLRPRVVPVLAVLAVVALVSVGAWWAVRGGDEYRRPSGIVTSTSSTVAGANTTEALLTTLTMPVGGTTSTGSGLTATTSSAPTTTAGATTSSAGSTTTTVGPTTTTSAPSSTNTTLRPTTTTRSSTTTTKPTTTTTTTLVTTTTSVPSTTTTRHTIPSITTTTAAPEPILEPPTTG